MLMVTMIPFYIAALSIEPGFLKKKFNYIDLIDKALENDISLEHFCSYDEVMKTETSFHCNTCGKCVELFDHHCPFINNCLGYRNYKYFLIFIYEYAFFLLCVFLETVRHLSEVYKNRNNIPNYHIYNKDKE